MHDYNECQGASNFLFSIYSAVSFLGFVVGYGFDFQFVVFSIIKFLNFTPLLYCSYRASSCGLTGLTHVF